MSSHTLYELFGWIGSIQVVTAYFLNIFNKMSANSIPFYYLNISGSAFLLANTIYHEAIPSSVVNSIWIILAFISMSKIKQVNQKSIHEK